MSRPLGRIWWRSTLTGMRSSSGIAGWPRWRWPTRQRTPRGTIHSNRQLPLLMEFPLKPGRVTVARLSEATGELRLVIGTGEMVQAPPAFTGTTGVLRFDRPAAEVLDIIAG